MLTACSASTTAGVWCSRVEDALACGAFILSFLKSIKIEEGEAYDAVLGCETPNVPIKAHLMSFLNSQNRRSSVSARIRTDQNWARGDRGGEDRGVTY